MEGPFSGEQRSKFTMRSLYAPFGAEKLREKIVTHTQKSGLFC